MGGIVNCDAFSMVSSTSNDNLKSVLILHGTAIFNECRRFSGSFSQLGLERFPELEHGRRPQEQHEDSRLQRLQPLGVDAIKLSLRH